MDRVAVRELRQNLSVYLRRVKRGETLEVTERGEPVAILAPLREPDDPIDRLAARGLVARRATKRFADLPPPLKLDLERPMSEILDELGEDIV